MKNLLVLVSMLLTSSAFAVKVGKVDVQKVLMTIKASERVRGELKKEFEKKQAEIKKEESKLKKEQETFSKQAQVMNASTKAKKQQELQQKFIALQQRIQKEQRAIQKKEQSYKGPILKNIGDIVKDLSKKKALDLTYESGTTPLLYVKEVTDLTSEVIKAYDKKHK